MSDGGCVEYIQQQHKLGEVHLWDHIEILLGFMLRVCSRNSAHSPKPHDIAVGLLCPCTFQWVQQDTDNPLCTGFNTQPLFWALQASDAREIQN